MNGSSHHANRWSLRCLARSVFCLCLVLGLSQSHAATAGTQSPSNYQGAYWAVQGHAGYTTGLAGEQGIQGGPSFGLSLRLASIVSLADVQLTALGSSYQMRIAETDYDVLRASVGLEAHLHPFFLLTLNDSYWETWLAGIYVSVGCDLDLTSIGNSAIEPDFGWHLGLGTDIPLTNLDDGSSFWLGLGFRLKFLDVKSPTGKELDLDEATLVLTFGYRDHDINFTRWPRPTEFYESVKTQRE